jgi:hypothetical protein
MNPENKPIPIAPLDIDPMVGMKHFQFQSHCMYIVRTDKAKNPKINAMPDTISEVLSTLLGRFTPLLELYRVPFP